MQENNMNYPKFKVCVRCFTFNQAKYITDAMNGFTMQQTSFPFVCTIVDDASTDGEQDVIRKYVEDNFDFSEGSVAFHKETDYAHITYAQHKTNKNCFFAVLYLKENHYSQRKPKMGYLSEWRDMCEYEAICEGDDYWIHPKKLQMQVSFLEANLEYTMSHTSVDYFYENVNKLIHYRDVEMNTPLNQDGIIPLESILTANYRVQTLSVVFRKTAYIRLMEMDPFLYRGGYFMMGDTQLWFGLAMLGKVHFLKEVTGIYRRNPNSFSNQMEIKKSNRFSLSSAEMRYYISLHYDIDENVKKQFRRNYEKRLIVYCANDSMFIPRFPIEIKYKGVKSIVYVLEDYMFVILRKLFARYRKMCQKEI